MLPGGTAASGARAERAPRQSWLERAVLRVREDPYRLGVGVISAALATFLLFQMTVWPPHEDETLVFFVTQQPIGDVFSTVFAERGGAPLHWLLAYRWLDLPQPDCAAARVGGLRGGEHARDRGPRRPAHGQRTALVAAALAAASWVTIYHGIYARMYSLFLFLIALSFLTLLRAVGTRDPRRWAAWIAAMVLTIATQPYGTFVLAAQAVYVLARRRRREFPLRPAAKSFAIVVALVAPLWLIYRVLASRFGIGLTGESDSKLGHRSTSSSTSGTRSATSAPAGPRNRRIAALAALGGVVLFRTRPAAVLLTARCCWSAMAVGRRSPVEHLPRDQAPDLRPTVLPDARRRRPPGAGRPSRATRRPSSSSASPRFSASSSPGAGTRGGTGVAGEPAAREQAREKAAAWLPATSRPDDILFGSGPSISTRARRERRSAP